MAKSEAQQPLRQKCSKKSSDLAPPRDSKCEVLSFAATTLLLLLLAKKVLTTTFCRFGICPSCDNRQLMFERRQILIGQQRVELNQ